MNVKRSPFAGAKLHDTIVLISVVFAWSATTFCSAEVPEYPPDFGRWVQERVGPVVFPEGSSKSWEQFTDLARELGCRAVKTWVGAEKPGEALQKMQTEPYRQLCRDFRVVHFNISLAYIADQFQPGVIAPEMLKAAGDEWREITLLLCRERTSPDQVFLLSVGGEINVYLGTKDARPDFPVAQFVNACHAAKEAALAELAADKRCRAYTVAELQGDKEYERFAEQWVSQFNTDLISLSYYTFYCPLDDSLRILGRHVKPMGPFGEHRLMLGEYGPSLESCNWNQAEQLRWHDEILREAFRGHIQFAFFYELADHEAVIKTGSHDGLVAWSPGPVPRLDWNYYRQLYKGEAPVIPQIDLYEVQRWSPPAVLAGPPAVLAGPPAVLAGPPAEPGAACANLTLTDVRPKDERPQAGQPLPFCVTVVNAGTAPSQDTAVSFYVDDRMISWVWVPSLAPGQKVDLASNQGDPRFVWRARPGLHRATAAVDVAGRLEETSKEDNRAQTWVRIAAAER